MGLGQCLCNSGFTGQTCEYRTDSCQSRPCRHGGLCLDTGNGAFKCLCPAGYGSAVCEARLSAGCAARPCLNAGVCRPASRGARVPHCICPEGFDGARCEHVNACASHPCLNGGQCTILHRRRYHHRTHAGRYRRDAQPQGRKSNSSSFIVHLSVRCWFVKFFYSVGSMSRFSSCLSLIHI